MKTRLTNETKQDFIAEIIEIFESFLDNKDITISNDEKIEAEDNVENPDEIANIYGSDYGAIQTDLENLIDKWQLTENNSNKTVTITASDTKDSVVEKLKALNPIMTDMIYRCTWMKYVVEDILNYAEDNEIKLDQDEAAIIAKQYVYDGKYDCNLSYWTNIKNLIDNYRSNN